MSKSNPRVGDQVHVLVNPKENNGSDVAAGQIVNLYKKGDDKDSQETFVNVKVVLDADNDRLLRDLPLLDKRPEDDDEVEDATVADGIFRVAFWPSSR